MLYFTFGHILLYLGKVVLSRVLPAFLAIKAEAGAKKNGTLGPDLLLCL